MMMYASLPAGAWTMACRNIELMHLGFRLDDEDDDDIHTVASWNSARSCRNSGRSGPSNSYESRSPPSAISFSRACVDTEARDSNG